MSDDLYALMSSMDDTPIEREDFIRCPFPYVGSKTRSLANLIPHLPYTDTWVDAFGGSGSVTLARRKCKFEVFNDRHAGIVSFYRCLRNRAMKDALYDRLEMTVYAKEEFVWCRDTWDHHELDDVERAARWFYMVSSSFGGVGRNWGRAKVDRATIAGKFRERLVLFEDIHRRFTHVQIDNLDWRTVLKDYDSHSTVFYLDPPYYGKNVYAHNMAKDEHIEMCTRIFKCEGFVALSGYDNPIYNMFPWDSVHRWQAHVSVTSKAITTDTSRVDRLGLDTGDECLWLKNFESDHP